MLVQEGDARSARVDMRLAAAFAGVAGAMNSAGFHAFGYFSANMTGNASAISDFVAIGRFAAATLFALIIVAFIAGAFLSALLIEIGKSRSIRAIYAGVIALEALLLALLGVTDLFFPLLATPAGLILGLAFLMGLQNATTTRISGNRVRTTHVSGMATDIGLALGLLASPARATGARAALGGRLRLHFMTIVAFILGGVGGVLVYEVAGGILFLVTALFLLALCLPEMRRAARQARLDGG